MKKQLIVVIALVSLIFVSSCGVNHAVIVNQNQNSTQVHLGNNNYNVIQRVSGSAEVEYVLIFGGMNRQRLYESAYADMVAKANLTPGSKALVNVGTEEHVGGFPPFYYIRTITVSAHVIEFTR